jgi:hypothetical protein
VDRLQGTSTEFYRRIEEVLRERQVPELDQVRVEYHEGGLLSAKREYLKLSRERLTFEICAASFGRGFFISWRLGEVPLYLNVLALLLLFLGVSFLGFLVINVAGICTGTLLIFLACVVVVVFARRAVGHGLANMDAALLSVPIIGAFYELYVRPLTYYRIDLALMYQQAVHGAIVQVVDELTTAQGLPPLSEFERKPVMRELYSR